MTTQEKFAYMISLLAGLAVVPAAGAGYLAIGSTGASIAGTEWLLVTAAPVLGWLCGFIILITVFTLIVTYLFDTIDERFDKQVAAKLARTGPTERGQSA